MHTLLIVIFVLIVICICLSFKAFPKQRKNLIIIFVGSAIAVLMLWVIQPFLTRSDQTLCSVVRTEAFNVAAALSDYFADPKHIKTPPLDQLNYMPHSYVKESEIIVLISGDVYEEIEIWLIAAKDQCPRGKAYVYDLSQNEGRWLDSCKEN